MPPVPKFSFENTTFVFGQVRDKQTHNSHRESFHTQQMTKFMNSIEKHVSASFDVESIAQLPMLDH